MALLGRKRYEISLKVHQMRTYSRYWVVNLLWLDLEAGVGQNPPRLYASLQQHSAHVVLQAGPRVSISSTAD